MLTLTKALIYKIKQWEPDYIQTDTYNVSHIMTFVTLQLNNIWFNNLHLDGLLVFV